MYVMYVSDFCNCLLVQVLIHMILQRWHTFLELKNKWVQAAQGRQDSAPEKYADHQITECFKVSIPVGPCQSYSVLSFQQKLASTNHQVVMAGTLHQWYIQQQHFLCWSYIWSDSSSFLMRLQLNGSLSACGDQ